MDTSPINSRNSSESGPTLPSDEHLMLAWTHGSAEAFAELFRRYKQPIFGFFRRRTNETAQASANGASQAEELTQETFFAIVRAAKRYEPRALFRTYLYAIAFKILRAHRRKTIFRAAFFGRPSSQHDPARSDATEAALWVRRAVEKLDSIDREVLMLREYEQLSYAEIADILHLPLNTVRSRLFRARTALRDLLEPPALAESHVAASPAPTGELS